MGARKRAEGEDAYTSWFAAHETDCDINHQGTSGLMEVKASSVIWNRSLEKGFRYTTLVSDGDSKTFLQLTQDNPYDTMGIFSNFALFGNCRYILFF